MPQVRVRKGAKKKAKAGAKPKKAAKGKKKNSP